MLLAPVEEWGQRQAGDRPRAAEADCRGFCPFGRGIRAGSTGGPAASPQIEEPTVEPRKQPRCMLWLPNVVPTSRYRFFGPRL